MDDDISQWIKSNPKIFEKIVATAFFVLGIFLIVGAVRDWNWLYEPDKEYHRKWSMGQLSRYAGRKTARTVGFIGGIVFTVFGCVLVYGAFFKQSKIFGSL